MANKITAKTSFLHPVTKKRVKRGDVVEDTNGVPNLFLKGVPKVKKDD